MEDLTQDDSLRNKHLRDGTETTVWERADLIYNKRMFFSSAHF